VSQRMGGGDEGCHDKADGAPGKLLVASQLAEIIDARRGQLGVQRSPFPCTGQMHRW
jgi:hypothetical protein